jgi:diacylglycerol kinase (ATP)
MKALLIYNPVAGPRDVEQDLNRAIAFLESQGWQVTLRRTLGRGDATTYAREAVAAGCDVCIVAGGDGTLGEAATGLAGSDCPLGLLPVGTGNVWAHMVGLPVWSPTNRTALVDAAAILVNGQHRQVDLGCARDRCFLLWSGIGFDAKVARSIEPHREIRRSLGNLTYVITALVQSLGMRGVRTTVVVDGKAVRERLLLIVVSNAQLYGSSWRLAPQAQLDNGLLEVYLFRGGSTLDVFRHFFMILLGEHQHDPRVERYRARSVEIRGERPLPVHIDGDPAGATPISISVAPRALRVIVPEWTSGSLFEGSGVGDAEDFSLAQRIVRYLGHQRDYWREEGAKLRTDLERRLGFPPDAGED